MQILDFHLFVLVFLPQLSPRTALHLSDTRHKQLPPQPQRARRDREPLCPLSLSLLWILIIHLEVITLRLTWLPDTLSLNSHNVTWKIFDQGSSCPPQINITWKKKQSRRNQCPSFFLKR